MHPPSITGCHGCSQERGSGNVLPFVPGNKMYASAWLGSVEAMKWLRIPPALAWIIDGGRLRAMCFLLSLVDATCALGYEPIPRNGVCGSLERSRPCAKPLRMVGGFERGGGKRRKSHGLAPTAATNTLPFNVSTHECVVEENLCALSRMAGCVTMLPLLRVCNS